MDIRKSEIYLRENFSRAWIGPYGPVRVSARPVRPLALRAGPASGEGRYRWDVTSPHALRRWTRRTSPDCCPGRVPESRPTLDDARVKTDCTAGMGQLAINSLLEKASAAFDNESLSVQMQESTVDFLTKVFSVSSGHVSTVSPLTSDSTCQQCLDHVGAGTFHRFRTSMCSGFTSASCPSPQTTNLTQGRRQDSSRSARESHQSGLEESPNLIEAIHQMIHFMEFSSQISSSKLLTTSRPIARLCLRGGPCPVHNQKTCLLPTHAHTGRARQMQKCCYTKIDPTN